MPSRAFVVRILTYQRGNSICVSLSFTLQWERKMNTQLTQTFHFELKFMSLMRWWSQWKVNKNRVSILFTSKIKRNYKSDFIPIYLFDFVFFFRSIQFGMIVMANQIQRNRSADAGYRTEHYWNPISIGTYNIHNHKHCVLCVRPSLRVFFLSSPSLRISSLDKFWMDCVSLCMHCICWHRINNCST